jgi:hypothetical protein
MKHSRIGSITAALALALVLVAGATTVAAAQGRPAPAEPAVKRADYEKMTPEQRKKAAEEMREKRLQERKQTAEDARKKRETMDPEDRKKAAIEAKEKRDAGRIDGLKAKREAIKRGIPQDPDARKDRAEALKARKARADRPVKAKAAARAKRAAATRRTNAIDHRRLAKLSADVKTKIAKENRKHAKRMAKLRRLYALSRDMADEAFTAKLKALRERETSRHRTLVAKMMR